MTVARVLVALLAATLLGACVQDVREPEPSPQGLAGSVWDLLWISDQWAGHPAGLTDTTPELWARRIERSRDVDVNVQMHLEVGLPAARVLELLDADDGELPSLVADAEIVAFFGDPTETGMREDYITCFPGQPKPFRAYRPEELTPYGDVLADIFRRVLELRGGAPTVIRVHDVHAAFLPAWREAGLRRECLGFFELLSATIRNAAHDYSIPMVSLLDAFNGPDHNQDPKGQGYTNVADFHLSSEGQAVLVELLHGAGYQPASP